MTAVSPPSLGRLPQADPALAASAATACSCGSPLALEGVNVPGIAWRCASSSTSVCFPGVSTSLAMPRGAKFSRLPWRVFRSSCADMTGSPLLQNRLDGVPDVTARPAIDAESRAVGPRVTLHRSLSLYPRRPHRARGPAVSRKAGPRARLWRQFERRLIDQRGARQCGKHRHGALPDAPIATRVFDHAPAPREPAIAGTRPNASGRSVERDQRVFQARATLQAGCFRRRGGHRINGARAGSSAGHLADASVPRE